MEALDPPLSRGSTLQGSASRGGVSHSLVPLGGQAEQPSPSDLRRSPQPPTPPHSAPPPGAVPPPFAAPPRATILPNAAVSSSAALAATPDMWRTWPAQEAEGEDSRSHVEVE